MDEWRVRWSAAARRDLLAIAQYIADENPTAAAGVLDRLQARAESLERLPRRSRRLHGFSEHGTLEYREVIEAPWRILYRIAGSDVQIIAVVDGRRDVMKWLNQRAARFKAIGP